MAHSGVQFIGTMALFAKEKKRAALLKRCRADFKSNECAKEKGKSSWRNNNKR